jgi:hypothetical protein
MSQKIEPSPFPFRVAASAVPNSKSRLIIEDCLGNSVAALSLRGVQGRLDVMEANAQLLAAAPVLVEACKSALALINISTEYAGMSTAKELESALLAAGFPVELPK